MLRGVAYTVVEIGSVEQDWNESWTLYIRTFPDAWLFVHELQPPSEFPFRSPPPWASQCKTATRNSTRTSAKTATSTSTRNSIRTSAKTATSTSTRTSMYWQADGWIIRKRLATALWRRIRFRMLGQSFWLYTIKNVNNFEIYICWLWYID